MSTGIEDLRHFSIDGEDDYGDQGSNRAIESVVVIEEEFDREKEESNIHEGEELLKEGITMDECEEAFLGTTAMAGCHLAMIVEQKEEQGTIVDSYDNVSNLQAATRLLRHALELLRQMKPNDDEDEKRRLDVCFDMYNTLRYDAQTKLSEMTRARETVSNPLLEILSDLSAQELSISL